jgi:hypothetical protein
MSDENVLLYKNPNAKTKTPDTLAEIRIALHVQTIDQLADDISAKIYYLLKDQGYTKENDDYFDFVLMRETIKSLALRSIDRPHPFHNFVYELFTRREDGVFKMNEFMMDITKED